MVIEPGDFESERIFEKFQVVFEILIFLGSKNRG